MTTKIKDGYILLARNIIDSEIWQKPPAYLKIWVYILSKVCWKETRKNPVGQELFNFRQEKIPGVTLNQIYEFLRWAKTLNPRDLTTQITTQKTTRGIYIKVTKYEYYQDPNNYISPTQKPTQIPTAPQHYKRIINNSTINTSINNSLSTKNERPKISKEEREILKSYSKKQGAKNINAYIRKLIDNGDYLNILEEEQKKAAKRKAGQTLIEAQKATEIQEPELTEEERQKILERAREIAGIDKKRRGKKL